MAASILSNKAEALSVCSQCKTTGTNTLNENKRLLHDQMNDNTLQTCVFFVNT